MPPAPARSLLLAALGALGAAACGQTGTVDYGTPPPTVVVVDPAVFLGDGVVCLDAPGGMRRYVATLFDVAATNADAGRIPLDGGELALPSSAPTPCFTPVHFSRVVPGHWYVAEVDGYDTADLQPLTPGSRAQVSSTAPGAPYVAPRWTSSCGRVEPADLPVADAATPPGDSGDAGTVDAGTAPRDAGGPDRVAPSAFGEGPVFLPSQAAVVVRGCTPLRDHSGTPGATGLAVTLPSAAESALCGEGGTVRFEVRLDGAAAPARTGGPGETITFEGLAPERAYSFTVRGSAGGAAACTATCYRRTVAGVVAVAPCTPPVATASDAGPAAPGADAEAGAEAGPDASPDGAATPAADASPAAP